MAITLSALATACGGVANNLGACRTAAGASGVVSLGSALITAITGFVVYSDAGLTTVWDETAPVTDLYLKPTVTPSGDGKLLPAMWNNITWGFYSENEAKVWLDTDYGVTLGIWHVGLGAEADVAVHFTMIYLDGINTGVTNYNTEIDQVYNVVAV